MKIFFDTWGWLELRDKRAPRHTEVLALLKGLRPPKDVLYTTDYVLDETFTAFFKRLSFPQARESLLMLEQSVEKGVLLLEWITPTRFEAAKKWRLKYQDKPRISFTDLTSIVVMNELGIMEIVTADAHFTHVGMGFHLLP